jgi:tetratricopeptide (TPR) repeat protein
MKAIPSMLGGRVLPLLLACALGTGCGWRTGRHFERAERYFASGDYDNAKIEYLNVLRRDFRNPKAVSRLGTIWLEQGAPLRACLYLIESRDLDPGNLKDRSKLATIYASLGEKAEARQEALAVVDGDPTSLDALLVLADLADTEADFEEVTKKVRQVPDGNDLCYHVATGSIAIRRGELAFAQTEFETALKLDPNSARTRLALANVCLLRQNFDGAAKEFQVAAELSPPRSTARLQYAVFERNSGREDHAVALLQEITGQAADYFPAWCSLSEIALSHKKYSEALSFIDNVLSRDPENLDALLLRAKIWVAQNQTQKAVSALELLSIKYPRVPFIQCQLARAYLGNGNSIEAAGALDNAIAAKPDYNEALLLLGELNLRVGKPGVVIPAMRKILKREPGLMAARSLLIEAYRSSGRPDDAAAVIRDQMATIGESAETYTRLGNLLREARKPGEARTAFEQALDFSPGLIEPLVGLVELDLANKQFDSASARIKQYCPDADSAAAHFLRGRTLAAQEKFGDAVAAFRRALELNPNFPGAFDSLVAAYVGDNKLPEAVAELQKFLSAQPENETALSALGMVYQRMHQYDQAREIYEHLLALAPNSVAALNDLAYLYANQFDQPEKAYPLARKARDLSPNDPWIADTMGWTLVKTGDYQAAVPMLHESVSKLPDSPDVQFHFGIASYMMGDTEAAGTAFRQALASQQEFSKRGEAQTRLAILNEWLKRDSEPESLRTLLGEYREDVVGWLRLADIYERRSQYQEAVTAYEQALTINPELLRAAIRLAQLYGDQLHNKEMAFTFAKRARDLVPNDCRVGHLLGRSVYNLGNYSWAYGILQESARQCGEDATVLHDFGWAAYSLGRVGEARRVMLRISQTERDAGLLADANTFLAMTHLADTPEQLIGSESDIEAVLQKDPAYAPALCAKARLLLTRGDNSAAERIYSDVLRRYPDFASVQKFLASIYAKQPDKLAQAYALALKARNALPEDAELATILGEISYKRNDFDYAIHCFQEGGRKKRLEPRSLFYLGMSQLHMSQDTESGKTLQKAIAAGLPTGMANDANKALSELRSRSGVTD